MATQLAHDLDPSDAMWAAIEHAAMHDDGAAAQGHLDAGFPIYYAEDDTPAEMLIKEYPGGRRELIRLAGRDEIVVRALA